MPSTLDALFRFVRHDEPTATCPATWSVSVGTLEMQTRLYRIMYRDGKDKYEEEISIPLQNYKRKLFDFYSVMKDTIANHELFCLEFRDACQELIDTDPWLKEVDNL
jgi:hypothetical protein